MRAILPSRPLASLSSGLLARKGDARPAMRRPAFGQVDSTDLGWNDMGEDVAHTAPAPPPVIRERQILEEQFRTTFDELPVKAKAGQDHAATNGKKAAFTLRLDPARHLRLRLAAAMTRRSAQSLVVEALDELLFTMNEHHSVKVGSGREC